MTDFKLWRRKFGVLTLLLACVAMTGWVRSFIFADWIERSSIKIVSLDGGVCGEYTRNLHEFIRKLSLSTVSAEHAPDQYRFSTRSAHWNQKVLGFGLKTYGGDSRNIGGIVYNSSFSVYRIPYWSIALPLTALSAHLLLSRPRTRKPSTLTNARGQLQ
ncbi:hypothetical protein [Schlesneria paludicola]|uniref:hypothetical protein n=1 Tax=Schlesneria paludicola TaxID=360056 RepID=UPI00029A48A7|nr:hypothetical protein [Schlesneria paludicola]